MQNDLVVALRIRADSEDARRKVEQIEKKIGDLGLEAKVASGKAARALLDMKAATDASAGAVGNLAAQFNDIGIMLAAGQNPLQLAIQQGTQITQVIGPMGATGAVRALGQAFVSLLSPVNLVTLGVIAGGAALVQWLTDAGEKARSLEDALSDVSSSLKEWEKLAGMAAGPASRLSVEYGDASKRAQELYEVLARIARLDALDASVEAAQKLSEIFDGGWLSGGLKGYLNQLEGFDAQERMGVHADDLVRVRRRALEQLRQEYGVTRAEAENLVAALDDLAQAKGPEEVAAAAQALSGVFDRIETRAGEIPDQLTEAVRATAELEQATIRLKASQDDVTMNRRKAEQEARKLLATLENEAAVQAMIAQFGKDSAAVERLRALQASEAFRARVEEMNISDELKARLIEAWDAARGLAATDMAGAVENASSQAAALADELARAAGNAMSLVSQGLSSLRESEIRLQFKDDPTGLAKALAGARFDARVGDISGADPILQEGLRRQREAYVANAEAVARNKQALAAWNREQRRAAASVRATRKELEEQATGLDAAKETLTAYAEKAADLGKGIGDSLVGAFRSAEQAIRNFVRTGKLDFRSLVTSILADFAQLSARRFILGPLANALSGALGGLGSIFAPVMHAGGVVGAGGPTRAVPAMAFAGAPRMHAGGWAGLRPDEVPAILQRGERVLSRREVAAGVGAAPVNITIQTRDAESFRQSRAQVAADIARAVALGRRGM